MIITITYDYVAENSKSYLEGKKLIDCGESFTTNCLEFFDFDLFNKRVDDVVVLKKDGTSISLRKLLDNNAGYTDKEIREAHNAKKLLISGALEFKENVIDRVDLGKQLESKYLYITYKDFNKIDSIIEQIKKLDIKQGCDSGSIKYIKEHFTDKNDVYYVKFNHILDTYQIDYEISTSRKIISDYINDQGYEDGGSYEEDFIKLCTEISIDEFLKLKFKNTYKITQIKEILEFGDYVYNDYYVYIQPTAYLQENERIKISKDRAEEILKILNK